MNKISRVTRTKKDARRSYNRLSAWYDFLAKSEEKYRQMGIKVLSISPGDRVLEIGSGTGTSLHKIANLVGGSGRVVGLDLSDGMISIAQERLDRAGYKHRSGVVLGDGSWLPFRPAFFDAVLISFTLELFDTPEMPLVLSQCRRVLRAGGRLGIVALQKTSSPRLPELIYEWCHDRMPVLVDCRPIDARSLVETAGFMVLSEQRESMWGLPVTVLSAVVAG